MTQTTVSNPTRAHIRQSSIVATDDRINFPPRVRIRIRVCPLKKNAPLIPSIDPSCVVVVVVGGGAYLIRGFE
jgi:hypothetical protein